MLKRIIQGLCQVDLSQPSELRLSRRFSIDRTRVHGATGCVSDIGLVTTSRGKNTKISSNKDFTDFPFAARPINDHFYARGVYIIELGLDDLADNKALAARPTALSVPLRDHISRCDKGNESVNKLGRRYVCIDTQFCGIASHAPDQPDYPCGLMEERNYGAASEIKQEIGQVDIPLTTRGGMKFGNCSLCIEMTSRYPDTPERPVNVSGNVRSQDGSDHDIAPCHFEDIANGP